MATMCDPQRILTHVVRGGVLLVLSPWLPGGPRDFWFGWSSISGKKNHLVQRGLFMLPFRRRKLFTWSSRMIMRPRGFFEMRSITSWLSRNRMFATSTPSALYSSCGKEVNTMVLAVVSSTAAAIQVVSAHRIWYLRVLVQKLGGRPSFLFWSTHLVYTTVDSDGT